MANIIDYLVWRGDLSFAQDSFNEVDNLILSELSYFDFGALMEKGETIRLDTFARRYFKIYAKGAHRLGLLLSPILEDLLLQTAQSARFGGILVCDHVNIVKKRPATQFSATTFILPDGTLYVAFRGTDDNIVAWKESLSLAIKDRIPSHKASLAYLQRALTKHSGELLVGGHSKGGNLALYAALHLEEEQTTRIRAIYNNDGPGFRKDMRQDDAYLSLADRVHSLTPFLSVVGAMLEHGDDADVVASDGKGLLQHDAFTWHVKGNAFVRLPDRSKKSREIEKTVKTWTEQLSEKEQKIFLETLYRLLTASGATTLSELNDDKIRSSYKAAATLFTLKKETRDLVTRALLLFFRESRNAAREQKAMIEKNP